MTNTKMIKEINGLNVFTDSRYELYHAILNKNSEGHIVPLLTIYDTNDPLLTIVLEVLAL